MGGGSDGGGSDGVDGVVGVGSDVDADNGGGVCKTACRVFVTAHNNVN